VAIPIRHSVRCPHALPPLATLTHTTMLVTLGIILALAVLMIVGLARTKPATLANLKARAEQA